MDETHRHSVDRTQPDAKNYVAYGPTHVKGETAKPIHVDRNQGGGHTHAHARTGDVSMCHCVLVLYINKKKFLKERMKSRKC